MTVTVIAFVAEADAASVTLKVTLGAPAAVGVPEMTPVLERVSPAGSDPESTVQVFAPLPPVASKVCEYGVPTTPAGE